jgi:tagatose 6-phosphate kinase
VILCVNPNPAIDKTVVMPGFRLNAIHRPASVLALPGGKGCNVARALVTLGEPAMVTGWVGGHAGRFIEEGLAAEGIGAAFIHTAVESRTCLSIVDSESGGVTEIYERGEAVADSQVAELLVRYRALLGQVTGVTLSGTLPPGCPPDLYRTLIELARAHGRPAYLDSSGEALRLGLEGRPALVKPNAAEFADLAGARLAGRADIIRAAREVAVRYETAVVISMGAGGALAADGRAAWEVRAPSIDAGSAVGSGDCLLAGLVFGLNRGLPLADALRCGVAAGSANTLQAGAGRFARTDFERLLAETAVTIVHERDASP